MGWEGRGEEVMSGCSSPERLLSPSSVEYFGARYCCIVGPRPQLMGDQEWLSRVQTEKVVPVARGVHW